VDLLYYDETADVGVEILDAAQTVLSLSQQGYGYDTVGAGIFSNGTLYVHVFNDGAKPNSDYELELKDLGQMPEVTLNTDVSSGAAPLTVTFTATVDVLPPGTDPVDYVWDFDGDGVSDAQTEEATVSCDLRRARTYTPSVKVYLDNGTAGMDTASFSVTNTLTENEDNDDHLTAQPILSLTPIEGDLGPGPNATDGDFVDRYVITPPSSVTVTGTLTYSPYLYPMSLSVSTYDAVNDEFDVLASSDENTGEQVITYSFSAGVTYYISVYGVEDAPYDGNGYNLSFSI
jgi:hypothetical protein